jgi:hypothetical protein
MFVVGVCLFVCLLAVRRYCRTRGRSEEPKPGDANPMGDRNGAKCLMSKGTAEYNSHERTKDQVAK